jgi:hypothetical protein
LGRLPWFALERRILAFFFFVFFDIRERAYPARPRSLKAVAAQPVR